MEIWAIWLLIAGVLLIVEMLTLTFYLLWFGIGALAAAAVAWLMPGSFAAQALAACVVVIVLTVFTKPLTRRFRRSRGFKDAVDEIIGRQALVLEPIAPEKPGIVKVGGDTWSAVASEHLSKGETVIVISRGSAVLEVRRWGGSV